MKELFPVVPAVSGSPKVHSWLAVAPETVTVDACPPSSAIAVLLATFKTVTVDSRTMKIAVLKIRVRIDSGPFVWFSCNHEMTYNAMRHMSTY